MTPDIPFSTFRGFAKCVRPHELGEAPAQALEHVFPGFFANEAPNVEGKRMIEPVLGKLLTQLPDEVPYRYRRFGGGTTLPRGSYFSIASSEIGDDGGTLALELGAYADVNRFLCCVDSAEPQTFHGSSRFKELRYPRIPLVPRTLAVFHQLESEKPFSWTQYAESNLATKKSVFDDQSWSIVSDG